MSDATPGKSSECSGSDGPAGDFERTLRTIEELIPALKHEAAKKWGPTFLKGESASDFYQEALATALREADKFRGSTKAELYAWLREILINHMRQSVRKYHRQKRDVQREEPLAAIAQAVADNETPSGILEELERKHRLDLCLAKLTSEQRLVLELRVNEKLSHEEVGERIGKSAEAARKISQRAAVKLQQLFEAADC